MIYDADMDSDVGDVAALAHLLRHEQVGDIHVMAVTIVAQSTKPAPCSELLMRFANRASIPIGAYQGSDSGESGDHFASATLAALGATYGVVNDGREDYPDALAIIRTALQSLPDGQKCKFIVTGGFKNVSDLLDSSGGVDLVTQKVSAFYVMGGEFPGGGQEANANANVAATNNFASKTPVPVYWQGFEIGDGVMCGYPTSANPLVDPFKKAWDLSNDQLTANERASWDSLPILDVARPGYFTYSSPGEFDVYEYNGPGTGIWLSRFTLNASGKHRYSIATLSDAQYRTILNNLLLEFASAHG